MHRRSFYSNEVREVYAARFASELAGALYDLSITHKELARALGVTYHTVDSWTRVADPKLPSPHNLQRLCAVLDARKAGTGEKLARAAGMSGAEWPPAGMQTPASPPSDLSTPFPAPAGTAGTHSPTPATVDGNLPGNMPAALSGFVGRTAEIAQVRRLLNDARLLTLTGAGGVGKTRLALQVASGVAVADFPDGSWLVELDTLSDPDLISGAIANSLGIRQSLGSEPLEASIAQIEEKRLLILLDNCEHLVEACAKVAERLLQRCRNLHILATSREPLDCAGETTWVVPPLSVPQAPEEVGRAAGSDSARAAHYLDVARSLVEESEAAQLFIARASEKQPDFKVTELTGQSVAYLAQICRRLDGIPLALELAAARVRGMTLEEIATRLDESLRLLTHGRRTGLPRHQALQASLDWSHDLLALSERMLFRRLGVFVGGWTINAAEAVCSGDGLSTYGVLGNLMQLVSKSLVVAEQRADGTRYRFLETIRQYALERLGESGETEALKERHALFFTMLAERTSPQISLERREVWNKMIRQDLDNMRSALAWALPLHDNPGDDRQAKDDPRRVETGLRLAGLLYMFWSSRGEIQEGLDWMKRALDHSKPAWRTAARARILFAAGALTEQGGNFVRMAATRDRRGDLPRQFTEAREWLEESAAIWREIGDKSSLADTLMTLGPIYFYGGDPERGRILLGESLKLAREAGNTFALMFTLFKWGDCETELGNIEIAQERLRDSLTITRELGDKGLSTLSLLSLARIAWLKGDYETAQSLAEEGLAIRMEIGNEWPVASAQAGLAEILRSRGSREDYERAASLAERSLAVFRKFGDTSNAAWVLYTQGHIARGSGDYEHATSLWRESLAMSQALHKSIDVSLCLAALAGACYCTGRLEQAATLFGAVDKFLEARGLPWPPDDRESYKQYRSHTQSALGEESFRLEWERGRSMQEDDAAAFALTGVAR